MVFHVKHNRIVLKLLVSLFTPAFGLKSKYWRRQTNEDDMTTLTKFNVNVSSEAYLEPSQTTTMELFSEKS